MHDLRQFVMDETAATMVEYSVMLAAIAAVCLLVVKAIGLSVGGMFDAVKWW